MKKILVILATCAIFILSACGGSAPATTATTKETTSKIKEESLKETDAPFLSILSGRCDPYKKMSMDKEELLSLFANNFEDFEKSETLDDVPEDFYKAVTIMMWQDDDEYYDIGISAYTALSMLEKENTEMFQSYLPSVRQTFEGVSKFSIEDILILEFLSDSDVGAENPFENETESTTMSSAEGSPTLGEKNALQKAKDYLSFMPFSYTGLIDQLEYEGYTIDEATYGADNCGADWMEQAALKAQDYIDYTAFSRQGLVDQLLYEGFTEEEALYGAESVGF